MFHALMQAFVTSFYCRRATYAAGEKNILHSKVVKALVVYVNRVFCHCQSAEALMLGMYPPNGSTTQVVELHTLDTKYDYITANAKYVDHLFNTHCMEVSVIALWCSLCPKFAEYQAEFWSSSVWKDHQNITNAILNAISQAIHFPVCKNIPLRRATSLLKYVFLSIYDIV